MKKEAKTQLIKDICIFLACGIIITVLMAKTSNLFSSSNIFLNCFLAFFGILFLGGVYFGWKWANNVVTAISFIGIVMKVMLAVILGWIAFPVALIKDIVALVKACKEEKRGIKTDINVDSKNEVTVNSEK